MSVTIRCYSKLALYLPMSQLIDENLYFLHFKRRVRPIFDVWNDNCNMNRTRTFTTNTRETGTAMLANIILINANVFVRERFCTRRFLYANVFVRERFFT